MFTALDVIVDAFERCNRLSPGETLDADDSARGFRRLNLLVDEMGAKAGMLFRELLTSAAQTGHITLGAGAWAAIPAGDQIVSAAVDGVPMEPLTMAQYNGLRDQAATGITRFYIPDGLATVFLYPVPTGQTIRLQTRAGVQAFADLNTTTYTAPPGVQSALGAALAVRIAPTVLGGVPDHLLRSEARCMAAIDKPEPAVVDARTFRTGGAPFNILTGAA